MFPKFFRHLKTSKYKFPRILSSRNLGNGEKTSDEDIFHSFHFLRHKCEGACRFHKFSFKLGNSLKCGPQDHMTLSFVVYFSSNNQAKIVLLTDKTEKYNFS